MTLSKRLFPYLLFAVFFFTIGFNSTYQGEKAAVFQHEGLYVYYLSEPISDYEVLGEFNGFLENVAASPIQELNFSTRRAKRKYPNAEGIIYTHKNMTSAKVIRFK